MPKINHENVLTRLSKKIVVLLALLDENDAHFWRVHG